VRSEMTFHLASDIGEVLDAALAPAATARSDVPSGGRLAA
jgi:hypothetical protein